MTEEKDQQQSRDQWREAFRSRLGDAAAQSLGIERTEEQMQEAARSGETKDAE